MTSTFVNNLALNEMATGDQSGSWGTVTNLNLELIGEGLGFATEAPFNTDANKTTTVAPGASDPARAMYFKVTSTVSGGLTATRQLTIDPDTINRLMFIENATTGGESITIKQGSGSGAAVTIPNGDTKAVILSGSGSGSIVLDAFASLSVVDLDVDGTANLDAVDIDGAVQIDNTVSVGVNDTGYDVKFFGDTASAFMLWDASADDLILGGAAGLSVNSTALVTGILTTTATAVFNGGFTSNGTAATFASSTANSPNIIFKNTTNDANAPIMDFITDKNAAGADNDSLGLIRFTGDNDAQQQTTFARVLVEVADASDGAEGGSLKLQVATHDGEIQTGLLLLDGNAEDEIDVTIGSGTSSLTSVAGNFNVAGNTNDFNGYVGSAVNAPIGVKSNSSHFAISIEENSGTETWQIGVDADGDLNFHNSGGSTPSIVFNDSGDVAIGSDTPESNTNFVALTIGPGASTGGGQLYVESSSVRAVFGADNNGADPKAVMGTTNNHPLVFFQNNADVGRFDASENFTIKSGNQVFGTAGKGVYLGVTTPTAANHLNDFETGTFDVTIVCGSGSIALASSGNLATYTKIGRLVNVSGRVNMSSVSSPSGEFRLVGMPFTLHALSEGAELASATVNLFALASDIVGVAIAEASTNNSVCTILIRENGNVTATVANIANRFDANSLVGFNLTYCTSQ